MQISPASRLGRSDRLNDHVHPFVQPIPRRLFGQPLNRLFPSDRSRPRLSGWHNVSCLHAGRVIPQHGD